MASARWAAMLVHVPITLGLQIISLLIGRALGVPAKAAIWLGAFTGSAACIMREITQHEYRWIERFGDGRRANMPFCEGLKFWDWNAHSISETLVAMTAAIMVAIAVSIAID